MTAVAPEPASTWAKLAVAGLALTTDNEPYAPIHVVMVGGVPMVPLQSVVAALDLIEGAARDYEARALDLTVAIGTRLVDVHAGGMREAAELARAALAETPEEAAARAAEPTRGGFWVRVRRVREGMASWLRR